MKRALFRFYAELNDFLPPERRQVLFSQAFEGQRTVRSLVEELGIPHTEIDIILLNGRSVDFAQLVEDGDAISVYPTFESLDVTPLVHLRPQPLRVTRFVADVHLGRLAAYLRLLGFDTRFEASATDPQLVEIALREKRILLTRDRELLKRRAVTHGIYVRAIRPREQITELVQRLDLRRSIRPFSRCLRCNESLLQVDKESVRDRVAPPVAEQHDRFHQCPSCGRVYWPGTHYRRIQQFLTVSVIGESSPDTNK